MSKEKLMQQLEGLENTNFNPDCLKDGLQVIADEAKILVHVVTGNLRNSIYVEVTENGGFVIADTDYAGIEEYREGHAYMRPAFDTKSDEALKVIAKATDEKIKEVVT